MPRRISPSQFRSKLQALQSKQRQAISRYNQAVRNYNRNLQSAINRYNQEVRAYNSRNRMNRQRIKNELQRLNSRQTTRYTVLRASVSNLHSTYTRLENAAGSRAPSSIENFYLDLAEREAANDVEVLNALIDPEPSSDLAGIQQTSITDEIAVISEELDARWQGALFSLDPRNPDAARHFCSSAREIFTQILDIKAPDAAVFAAVPHAQRTERGNATRRSKIEFIFLQKGIQFAELAEFASEDIGNIIGLFDILNAGTHGETGHYDMASLVSIKRRVEDGLTFLSRLAA